MQGVSVVFSYDGGYDSPMETTWTVAQLAAIYARAEVNAANLTFPDDMPATRRSELRALYVGAYVRERTL